MRQDIGRIKDYAVGGGQSSPKSDALKSRVLKIEKQIASLSKTLEGTSDDLNDQKDVENWLKDKVKLSQYFQVFVEQGFDDLEHIKDITKEDLEQMGIDKVGHQRRILKQAKLIQ